MKIWGGAMSEAAWAGLLGSSGYLSQQTGGAWRIASMKKLTILIAESVFPEDFYADNCEGHVVEAMSRVLHWKTSYKIALNAETLCRAIKASSKEGYDILHLSCHG